MIYLQTTTHLRVNSGAISNYSHRNDSYNGETLLLSLTQGSSLLHLCPIQALSVSCPSSQCLLNVGAPGPPCGSVVKHPPANTRDVGSIPDLGRSHVPWSNYAQVATTIELVL